MIPRIPGSQLEIVSYNISYLYLAGLRSDDPDIVSPVPIWGDETNGPDNGSSAWYATGTGPTQGFQAAGAAGQGWYGRVDNHGKPGANFVYTDGHGEFTTISVNLTFFGSADSTTPQNMSRSINAINPSRTGFIQTID